MGRKAPLYETAATERLSLTEAAETPTSLTQRGNAAMPKREDREFERHVAAAFQADGQFVERNRKDPTDEIMEVDMAAIHFQPEAVRTTICEVKNRNAGATDLFKLAGQARFLAATRTALVAAGNIPEGNLTQVASKLGIDCLRYAETGGLAKRLAQANLVATPAATGIEHCHEVDQVEDWLKAILVQRKSQENTPTRRAYDYLRSLEREMWWLPSAWDRASFSYQKYRQYGRVSLECAEQEELGGPGLSPYERLRRAYAYGEGVSTQAALYVETRARLHLVAAVCECAIDLLNNPGHMAQFDMPYEAFHWDETSVLTQPHKFDNAVATLLKSQDLIPGLPRFVQTWLFSWGGFFRLAHRDDEHARIAAEIGVSPGDVPRYIQLIDDLLAAGEHQDGSWLKRLESLGIETFQLLPEPFKGLGIRKRRGVYGADFSVENANWQRWEAHVNTYKARLEEYELKLG